LKRFNGVHVRLNGVRQDAPPKMRSISDELIVDTDDPDRHLGLLHQNVKRYGTVVNRVDPGAELTGTLRRAD